METIRWPIVVFAAAMLISPLAEASTELHGGAWFWNALGRGETAGDVRGDAALPPPMSYPTELSGAEDNATDAWAFAVDRALLGAATAPHAAKVDRFKWVFLLIGFAGLTAFFAGKRTGGHGLISG